MPVDQDRSATQERCQVITTQADPPHVHEVRCGRVLRNGWCPKHGQQAPGGRSETDA